MDPVEAARADTASLPEASPDAPTHVPVRVELAPEPDASPPIAAGAGGPGRAGAGARAVGRYDVLDEIGRGGMGIVYRAFDRDLRRHVAMKVLQHGLGPGEPAERFVEEAQATAQLQHPGIVPVYEIGLAGPGRLPGAEDRPDDAPRLFFTMKLVRGRTLADVVARARAGEPATAVEFTRFRLLQVLVEVARAVAYAHERGVIHRDLKPQNVMIGRYGEVQVMDWGLAKVLPRGAPAAGAPAGAAGGDELSDSGVRAGGHRDATLHGSLVGTPAYMSPEQARGDRDRLGPASDVYSLGATLHHAMTGEPPYRGSAAADVVKLVLSRDPPGPRAVDPAVPREVDAIVRNAMARSPAARYPTARALADDIQAYLEGLPVAAYPEGPVGRARKWGRRHRGVTATLGGALVFALLGSIASLVQIEGRRREAVTAREGERAARLTAEVRERDAARGLARLLHEKADRALEEREAGAAEVLFAKALTSEDRRETRERLVEARARGARLLRTLRGPPGARPTGPPPEDLTPAKAESADGAPIRWTFALLRRDGPAISGVAFSPDGRRLAWAAREGVRLGDAETGAVELVPVPPRPTAVSWSDDGRSLAMGGRGGIVEVLDLETRRMTAFRADSTAVHHVAFAPRSRLLAAVGRDRTVAIFDADRGEEVRRLAVRDVHAPAWSPDGGRIAVAHRDGTVRILDAASGSELEAVPGHDALLQRLAWSPDGRRLAGAGRDGSVWLRDLEAPRTRALAGIPGQVVSVAFSPDGGLVAAGGSRGSARLFETVEGRLLLSLRVAGSSTEVAFSPDGRRLAVGTADGGVQVFALDGDSFALLRARGPVAQIALDAAGRRLAWGSEGGAGVLEVETGRPIHAVAGEPVAQFRVALDPPGRRLAVGSGSEAGAVRVVDLETGREVASEPGLARGLYPVAFSPDGRTVASRSSRGTLRLLDAETGADLASLDGVQRVSGAIAFSPGGDRIAVTTFGGPLRVLDLASGVGRPVDVPTVASHFAFSPDGDRLAITGAGLWLAGVDGTAPVLLRTGFREGSYRRVVFDARGRLVAAGAQDGTARIFDVERRAELLVLRGHDGGVQDVAFHPDGRRFFTAGEDGAVRVWDLEAVARVYAATPAALLEEAERRTGLRASSLLAGGGPVAGE